VTILVWYVGMLICLWMVMMFVFGSVFRCCCVRGWCCMFCCLWLGVDWWVYVVVISCWDGCLCCEMVVLDLCYEYFGY